MCDLHGVDNLRAMLARQATPDDADELVRLRAVLLTSMPHAEWNDDWREPTRQSLVKRLADPDSPIAAFVVDRPEGDGLAACAVGLLEERLGNPRNPNGLSAYVFSVATDPDQRRRGYSRACMTGLLGWFRSRGVRSVDLRASAEGEPLYASLGFTRTADPAMRMAL